MSTHGGWLSSKLSEEAIFQHPSEKEENEKVTLMRDGKVLGVRPGRSEKPWKSSSVVSIRRSAEGERMEVLVECTLHR